MKLYFICFILGSLYFFAPDKISVIYWINRGSVVFPANMGTNAAFLSIIGTRPPMETKLLARRNISIVPEQSVKNGSSGVALGQRCLHTGRDNSACLRLETVFAAKTDKHLIGKC